MSIGVFVFDTAIGPCGLAWSDLGVVGVALPEPSAEATLARMMRCRADAEVQPPPPHIALAGEAIVALTEGRPADLTFVPLDFGDAADFERRVWAITRAIPVGETLTYGDIARRLGDVALSRAVGQALGANPIPIIVPCHRVVAADGSLTGYSGGAGVETKAKLLRLEGAAIA